MILTAISIIDQDIHPYLSLSGFVNSHGSIVAREYGIPAVVNVGPATKMIKTGQLIQVDGTHGLVKISKTKRD